MAYLKGPRTEANWAFFGASIRPTIKTFLAIALLSLLTELSPRFLDISNIHPAYGALLDGLLLGSGCLFPARHRASLGGIW